MNQIAHNKINKTITEISKVIEQGEAILVLGPDIMFNGEKMLLKEFSNFLNEQEVKHSFNDDEELFSSTSKFKGNVFRLLPDFFKTLECKPIHKKIAEIPCHVIISLSPDLLLKQTFDKNHFDCDFNFYFKEKSPVAVAKPTQDKPLLYNLLGIYSQSDSMVLCFNHLFDYLVSVLGKNELPVNLRDELKAAQTIFFLGFKYDKWYFKLIMRLLNKDDDVCRHASFKEVEKSKGIINFYTDEFKFVFIEELTGYEIVDQIHDYFKQKDTLRQPMKEQVIHTANVTNNLTFIGDGNLGLQDINGNIIYKKP